jgi:hypothetical protein
LFKPGHGRGIKAQVPRQIFEVPSLALDHLLVGADDREGQRVEILANPGSVTPAAISASERGASSSGVTMASAPTVRACARIASRSGR